MGELGESGKLGMFVMVGTESGAERRARFFRVGRAVMRYMRLQRGVLRGESCRKGDLRNRHDRRTASTRQKRKASQRRVRSVHQANSREQKHPRKNFPHIRGIFDIIYE